MGNAIIPLDKSIKAPSSAIRPVARYRVELAHSFDDVEENWRHLECEGAHSIYQTYDWLRIWHRHYGGNNLPLIISIYKDSSLVALLPVFVRSRLGVRYAVWGGGKHANFNAGLYTKEILDLGEELPWQMIWDEVAKRAGLSFAFLINQPAKLTSARSANPMCHLFDIKSTSTAAEAVLHSDFDSFFKKKRSKHSAKNLRKKQRGLAGLGDVTVSVPQSVDEVTQFLSIFSKLRQGREKFNNIPDPYDDQALKFFTDLARENLRSDNIDFRIYALKLNNEFLSFYGVGCANGRVSAMFNAVTSEQTSKFSPGTQLETAIIEQITSEGADVFDLGIGDGNYRLFWTNELVSLHDSVLAFTSLGTAITSALSLSRRIRHRIKSSKFVPRHVRRFIASLSR